ncbi:MAG TPA: bifunctional YncE family protein/alkaline phosphatase family protein [Terracidiphilus sp.]|jgi:DNA-binding beta-propeller fold protein YncE|nr:bifunctional YncE family protein/alkaline phosphatase family protein [Terracidiphilus sp.]
MTGIRLSLAVASLLTAPLLLAQAIDLPSSKQILPGVPGNPQRLNSLPVSMAVSPDQRYVVTLNDGYGTFESKYEQSLAVYDTQTGALSDFPDDRTEMRMDHQTLYSGLAFSADGAHLYASMASLTDPNGERQNDTGNGIVVYSFRDGTIAPERFIHIPLQQLATGHLTKMLGAKQGSKAIPYPAAIALVGSPEKLLVADNLSDDVLLIDPATGSIERRFDLAESATVPGVFPIALTVSHDGKRAFVALWNASEIVELDLAKMTVGRKLALLKPASAIAAGSHPCAFAIAPDGRTLYVSLANRDAIAAVNIGKGELAVKGYFDTRLPRQSYFGAEPVAVALDAEGRRLYAANMGSDAVAVIDTAKLTAKSAKRGMAEPVGFVPTEWMPISMAFSGGKLYVATDKGKGTTPNNMPQREVAGAEARRRPGSSTYIVSLLYGSLAVLEPAEIDKDLPQLTASVLDSNRMKAAEETIPFSGGRADPIKHVIYIIKENRTYDQILGDLEQDGKPVGNGDASLTMYGADITPNLHKLALQFGVLDNFSDSGEVSGDGHVWSNAAIGSDYLEKTWQQSYRGGERLYDFEGAVANGYPIEQKIADVNEPASGYLWGDLAAHHKTYYHFGEYISTIFCTDEGAPAAPVNPQQGPVLPGQPCAHRAIEPGGDIPAEWGGGTNKWPWAIPLIYKNTATKPELVGHFAPEAPDFELSVPDQIRVDIFLQHLKKWESDLKQGRDTMPNFIQLRLPNDHTAGTRPGGPTPKSSVADNDLAVGRAIEAISHSEFWDSTAFFVLEDDAQNGADHVDAHRSIALVVSKYSPKGPRVDSHFYTTVSMIRTMEVLLGLPPMNNDDAFAPVIASLFSGSGDQAAFTADTSNRDNNLIYTANEKTAPGAHESMKMDFRHADRADSRKLNVILWKDAMGNKPVPPMLTVRTKKTNKVDDDD